MTSESQKQIFVDYLRNRIGQFEIVGHLLYDVVTFSGELGVTHAFVEPWTPKKGQYFTNMFFPSRLPEPQAFMIGGLSVSGVDSEVPLSVMRSGMIALHIGSKVYFDVPLSYVFTMEEAAAFCGFKFDHGLGLGPGQNFAVLLKWHRAVKIKRPIKLRVTLQGELYRPV